MAALLLATTRLRDMQPLRVGGEAVTARYEVLREVLRQESDAHAALLSEPVPNPAQGEIDWYADGQGPARRLDQVPDAERTALQAELDRLLGDGRAAAARFQAGRSESDRLLGASLAAALQYAGPAHVHVVDGRPVLSAWGHAPAGTAAGWAALTGQADSGGRMAILPPPVPPTPKAGVPVWAVALAALAGLLVPSAAGALLLYDPFGWLAAEPAQCRVAPGQTALLAQLAEEQAREAQLRTELGRLVADAGGRRLMCPPPPAPPRLAQREPPPEPPRPPPEPPPPPPRNADAERVERQGGQSGRLQIILAWDDVNDLDLHVVCPSGERMMFNHRRACGGVLDVDANGDSRRVTRTPVENASWGRPQPGRYQVLVDAFDMRAAPRSRYRVTVRREGKPDEVFEGTAVAGQQMRTVTTVQVDP